MKREQIEELERLERAATPGPWIALYKIWLGLPDETPLTTGYEGEMREQDAALAAAARNAVPRLLEERKRLLEALRPFAETGGTATFRVMMHNYGNPIPEYDVARAAMAFAEAPAS